MFISPKITHKQALFIATLAKVGSIEAACKASGISRSTYYRWMESREFRDEMEAAKEFVYNSSLKEMKSLFTKAISNYEELAGSEDEAIRLRASREIVRNAGRFIKMRDYADKCEEWLDMHTDIKPAHPDA